MYKLLTTAAVIMTVATPSIANDWKGAQDLVNNLKDIYTNLDDTGQFGLLEGEVANNNGQLSAFFNEVDAGVTHITLTVDANNNITPGIVEGSTFTEIKTKADDLVNRVNFDLFVDVDSTNYVAATDYTGTTGFDFNGEPSNSGGDNDIGSTLEGGLAGVKITKLTTAVNAANNYLIGDITQSQADTFVLEYGAKSGNSSGVEVADIFGHIDDLNNAINTAKDTTVDPVDGNGFFGNIGLGGVAEGKVTPFAIPNYTAYNDIGNAGAGYFATISDWASGQQTITVDGTDYHFQGTETITVDGTNVTVGTEAAQAVTADARFVAVP